MRKSSSNCANKDKEKWMHAFGPDTETYEHESSNKSNRQWYTDYDERNEFRKPDTKSGVHGLAFLI